MSIILDGTAGLTNNATGLNYTGTLTGGTGVVNLGSGQVYKDASGNVGIGTSLPNAAGVDKALTISGASSAILELNFGINRSGYFFSNQSNTVLSAVYSGAVLAFNTNDTTKMRIASDGQQSSVIPGGATLYTEYKCRAWVNFNGTNTVAIRASGNVSSITDNGVGDYTVNFSTAMPDANYCSQITAQGGAAGNTNRVFGAIKLGTTPNTTAVAVIFADEAAGVFADPLSCYFAIFR